MSDPSLVRQDRASPTQPRRQPSGELGPPHDRDLADADRSANQGLRRSQDGRRGCRSGRRCAASSATLPARSSPFSPQDLALDSYESVRGVQYLAIRYTERLADEQAVASVGSKGDSYDNALAETVNGLYKTELIYKQRALEVHGTRRAGHRGLGQPGGTNGACTKPVATCRRRSSKRTTTVTWDEASSGRVNPKQPSLHQTQGGSDRRGFARHRAPCRTQRGPIRVGSSPPPPRWLPKPRPVRSRPPHDPTTTGHRAQSRHTGNTGEPTMSTNHPSSNRRRGQQQSEFLADTWQVHVCARRWSSVGTHQRRGCFEVRSGMRREDVATAPPLKAVVLIGSMVSGAVKSRSPEPRTTGWRRGGTHRSSRSRPATGRTVHRPERAGTCRSAPA